MLGERCCRIGLATTSPWIFQATDVPALMMPSSESGATSMQNKNEAPRGPAENLVPCAAAATSSTTHAPLREDGGKKTTFRYHVRHSDTDDRSIVV